MEFIKGVKKTEKGKRDENWKGIVTRIRRKKTQKIR